MERKNLSEIRKELGELKPIIHCITNPISINQCANAILSLGARPTMAEHPKEVKKITLSASALLINLGNITDARKKSFNISAEVASKRRIPIVIDLVGISGSEYRRKLAKKLIRKNMAIIKGNYSEIFSFCNSKYHYAGVDCDKALTAEKIINCAANLAKKEKCVVLASGKSDIVTDGKNVCIINNGCSQLAAVTGTGCMLGAICATFLSVASAFESATLACTLLGICGEKAETNNGNGTFLLNLLDNLSKTNEEGFKEKVEVRSIEEF